MNKDRVKATVRVVLDIEAHGAWGSDWTCDQIAKQAEDSVRGLLTNNNELTLKEIPKRIRSLEVVEVIVRKEKS